MSDQSEDQSVSAVDQLSNDELRSRLQNEFSFDCGPITASTRDVYLKKLFKLMSQRQETEPQNGNSEHSEPVRSSPARQSRASPRRPAERDVTPTQVKVSTPKTRRQSSAVSNKKNTSSAKTRKTISHSDDSFVVPLEPPPGSQTNSHPSSLNNYSSESSENEDKAEESIIKSRKSPRKKASQPMPRPAEPLPASQRVPSARPYLPSSRPMSSPRPLSPLARPPLRSPYTSGQLSSKLANYSDSEDTEQEQNNDYIRDRLLRHRPGLGIGSMITTKAAPIGPNRNGTGYEETNYSSSSNFISFAILTIVVLFFVFIFSFYFYTRISSSPKPTIDLTNFDFINGDELVAPICPAEDSSRPLPVSEICLKHKSDIMPALTIANQIKIFIDQSIHDFYCNSDHKIASLNDFKSVAIKDIKDAIRNKVTIFREGRENMKEETDSVIFNRDLANALILIQLNPNWQMIAVEDSIGDLMAISLSEGYPLNLPLACQAKLTLKLNSYKIMSAVVVILLTLCAILFYKRSKKLATEEQDIVYDLVEKSLELLQSPDTSPGSMPVLHIRDTLLTPSERKTAKYKKIWNKVVKHIESTESRVKVDLESIEGDDYKTWKWLPVNAPNSDAGLVNAPTIRTGSIEWQGQAFNIDQNASQAMPSNGPNPRPSFSAPTIFLKIRNMFDEETKLSNPKEWKNEIRSAVLEKVKIASKNGCHGVVHLEVEDSPEGLVYMKCNSIESATDSFNALHGWWCQKKLVSVKFLKPERYHQRFPDSQHTSSPLTSH